MRILLTILCSFLFSHTLYAKEVKALDQFPIDKQALSTQSFLKKQLPAMDRLELPPVSVPKNLDEKGLDAYRFATPYAVNISLDGAQWQNIGDMAVWRYEFVDPSSVSLSFAFKNVYLPKGTKLFVYSKDRSQAIYFDHSDNKAHKEIWTPVFTSTPLIIELNVPLNLKEQTSLQIAQINQAFRSLSQKAVLKSGACNIDVVCPDGDPWRDEINSAVRIIIDGSGACSGTLVNNTDQDETPYILSADHCGIDSSNAASLVFNWKFETSTCGGTPDGSTALFNTGATFRAGNGASDFTLVEMDSAPASGSDPYFAGWSNEDSTPSGVTGIHHPNGDEKRISFDTDSALITDEGSDTENTDGDYLRVNWDLGTTEPGSSGSAIWNSSKHIVGTLTSGLAACNNSVGNGQPDWYGRFNKHWQGGGTKSTSLSCWLDPASNGIVSTLGGSSTPSTSPGTTTTGSSSSVNCSDSSTSNNANDRGVGSLNVLFLLFLAAILFTRRYN